jgi:hypothetical protein
VAFDRRAEDDRGEGAGASGRNARFQLDGVPGVGSPAPASSWAIQSPQGQRGKPRLERVVNMRVERLKEGCRDAPVMAGMVC